MADIATLRRRLIGGYLVLAVIIVVADWYYYRAEEQSVRASAAAELQSVSELKIAQLSRWLAERLGDGRYMSQSPLLMSELRQWLATPTPAGREQLLALFEVARDSWHYANVSLTDVDGTVLLSLDEADGRVSSAVQAAITQAFATLTPQFTELHVDDTGEQTHLALIVPVFQSDAPRLPAAALVLETDPNEFLYPLLDEWPLPSASADTLLIRREGDNVLYLNHMRARERDLPLSGTLPLTRTTFPAVMAIQGSEGLVDGLDYRDVPVFAYVKPVPGSEWHLVVKKDRAEVFAGLWSTLISAILYSALILIAAVFFGLFIYRKRERDYLGALYQTQAVLNEKRAELELFFTHNPSLLCIGDIDGTIRRLNRAWAEQMGWDLDALLGRSISDFLHPDDADATLPRLAQLADHPSAGSFANRYRHADGSYHWLEWRSVVLDNQVFAAARDITAERAAAEAVRASEAKLRLAASLSGMIVATSDRDLRFTWVYNTQAIGLEASTMIGGREDEIFDPSKVPDLLALCGEVMATGAGVRRELWMDLPDGRHTYDVIIEPTWDSQGQITGTTVVALDISARKQRETAIHLSEERLRLAVAISGLTVATLDTDLRYTWIYNPYRTFDAAAAVGKRDDELTDAENAAGIMAIKQEALVTGRAVHREFSITVGGSVQVWDFVAQPTMDESGQVIGLTTAGLQITERKQAEDALRRSAAQLRLQAAQITQLVESAPEGVLLLDPDGRVALVNPKAQADLAAVAEIRVGEALALMGDLDLVELLSQNEGEWHEIEVAGHIFETAARALRPDGVLHGWVLILRDVTHARAAEAGRQRQERLAAVGQLAAGIAHDFNNILAVISLYTELTMRSPHLGEVERERLNTILRQSRQAAELVQQILDFSRQSILEYRAMALDLFLAEQIRLLHRTLPEDIIIGLTVSPSVHDYTVYADKTRLAQMVFNLATNARDAMPDGGELHFELTRFTQPQQAAPVTSGLQPGDWIVLRVRDTGSGIAPENFVHLFNPFFTTKDPGKGTGLGLAQVYGIVHQHGGTIEVASQLGEGTTFTIHLPARDAPAESAQPASGEVIQGHGQTILLVEDEEDVRAALAAVVRAWGYTVVEAGNGQEALALLTDQPQDIHLVLSDVVMPVMGGVAMTQAIRTQGLDLPIILLTGHPLGDEKEQLPPGTLTAWLTKPPALDHLSRTIAQALAAT